jgi:hypothetical protein
MPGSLGSITSANAVITLVIPPIFTVPQQVQQFSADNIFETDEIEVAETSMGVDGVLSGGLIYNEIAWNITLQANSPSNDLFDQWWQAQLAAVDVYPASGIVTLKSIGRKWVMTNGFLKRVTTMPPAGKTQRPRRFGIVWNSVTAQPIPV